MARIGVRRLRGEVMEAGKHARRRGGEVLWRMHNDYAGVVDINRIEKRAATAPLDQILRSQSPATILEDQAKSWTKAPRIPGRQPRPLASRSFSPGVEKVYGDVCIFLTEQLLR